MSILNFNHTLTSLTPGQPVSIPDLTRTLARMFEPQHTEEGDQAEKQPLKDPGELAASILRLRQNPDTLRIMDQRDVLLYMAAHYYSEKYPQAERLQIALAASLLQYCVTGLPNHECGAFKFMQEHSQYLYGLQLVATSAGYTVGESGQILAPSSESPLPEPSDERTEILFRLIESLFFVAIRPLSDIQAGIKNVSEMLYGTRKAFKSKIVMDARLQLEQLLAIIQV